jgi:hypothetical protein
MQIFLSYASEDRELADQIHLALIGAGHLVFFDRDSLPPGGDYHAKIRAAVERSDIFVFLITGNSVASGSYALTELKYARSKWPHPKGRVLPVRAGTVAWAMIPPYLKAVTVMEPEGNMPAEVSVAVHELEKQAQFRQRQPAKSEIEQLKNESSPDIERAHKITVPVLVAVIGMVSAIAGAAISNWHILFPDHSPVNVTMPQQLSEAAGVQLKPEQLYSSLGKSMVLVRVKGQGADGTVWTSESSGFFVSRDGKLVTVAYVLINPRSTSAEPSVVEKVTVRAALDPAGPWMTADVLVVDRHRELALLQVADSDETTPVSFSTNAAKPGDEIAILGNPAAMPATLVTGVVSSVESTRISVSAPTTSVGFAGSPVAELTGDVLGIARGQRDDGITLVFPANLVASFVKPLLKLGVFKVNRDGIADIQATDSTAVPRQVYYRNFEKVANAVMNTGTAIDGKGLVANPARDKPGALVFGPYIRGSDLGGTGHYVATFELEGDPERQSADGMGIAADERGLVGRVDVHSSDMNTLWSLDAEPITLNSFPSKAVHTFSVPFTIATGGVGMVYEFRVWWYKTMYLRVRSIQVNKITNGKVN